MANQKIYSSLKEFEEDAQKATKIAMKNTLAYFKDKLHDLIEEHIYHNAYDSTWYKRTTYLSQENAILTHVYNNFGKNGIGGSIKFNKELYDNSTDRSWNKDEPWKPFQHGNPDRYLELKSYLEIMNDSSLIGHAFNFPRVERGHFYDEFMEGVKKGNKSKDIKSFDEVFEEKFNGAMNYQKTGRPVIPRRNSTPSSSSVGSPFSSSTSHIPSYDSSRMY